MNATLIYHVSIIIKDCPRVGADYNQDVWATRYFPPHRIVQKSFFKKNSSSDKFKVSCLEDEAEFLNLVR